MLMRAPGSGLQEFNIRDQGDRRVLELCAYWHPAGFWGLLYWYAHLPLYSPLVQGAMAEVARRAVALDDVWMAAAEKNRRGDERTLALRSKRLAGSRPTDV